ncbi:hypothetical protein HL42_3097 [Trichophyton rubrum]|nr:hypothetical protein HL42_3097 [Trichophyton rubrum]
MPQSARYCPPETENPPHNVWASQHIPRKPPSNLPPTPLARSVQPSALSARGFRPPAPLQLAGPSVPLHPLPAPPYVQGAGPGGSADPPYMVPSSAACSAVWRRTGK